MTMQDEKNLKEIKYLQAEIAEMEKDGLANINAINRFNKKIESLRSPIKHVSMEAYMDSLRSDITTINEQPENECCDAVEIKVLENVLGIMNAHFGDYDTFCSENKAMAEFLESLGYSQEQITDIANGGNASLKVKRIFEVTTSDLSQDTLELLYYQKADFVPVNYERDGHFFHKSNVEDFLDLESYDEKPSTQTLEELKKLFNAMVQTKSCVLYLRNNNEERNDVL